MSEVSVPSTPAAKPPRTEPRQAEPRQTEPAPAALDHAIAELTAAAASWCATSVTERRALLHDLARTVLDAAPAWVEAASAAKGIPADHKLQGEEWGTGIFPIVRNLTLLAETLGAIEETGRPQPPKVRTEGARTVVDVSPADALDRLLHAGVSAEVWLKPGVSQDQALERMGRSYRPDHERTPGVALVLGAGNLSSIGAMDALSQLFVEDRVVLLKLNPVNAYLAPHLSAALAPLVQRGWLRIVPGGSEVGRYLTEHDGFDAIHITGAAATHDAIVFGTGPEGAERKRRGEPRIDTPITSELGNVSPYIIVPGPWSDRDLAYHGDAIASSMVVNAGFNCVTPRVIVQHRSWAKRRDLLDAVRDSLSRATPRVPYYPGALERHAAFVAAHPQAERFGPEGEGELPFTLIPDLDPHAEDDIAFTTEAFCGLMTEVALDVDRSVPDYLAEAVRFANDQLMGNLSATIVVHPRSLADPEVARAVDRAVEELRCGTVGVNLWAGLSYVLVAPPWGAYPGNPLEDIQSGRGVVHNTFLLADVEKTVLRGPFRAPITPGWFHTLGRPREVFRLAAELAASWDARTAARLVYHFLRG
ncbi:MAG: aldehyde dehydrogenase family protein [Nitriliruptoraceae bacterium]